MLNESPGNVLVRSKEEMHSSTDLNSRNNLIRRLNRSKDARARFVDSHLSKGIAFQIQALRDEKGWSQQELAERIGSNQNAVYRLENPNYGKPTLTTLKKVAAAFDVAVVVRFISFGQFVDWLTETPYAELGLRPEALAVPSFDDDEGLRAHGPQTVDTPTDLPVSQSWGPSGQLFLDSNVPAAIQRLDDQADIAGNESRGPQDVPFPTVEQKAGGVEHEAVGSFAGQGHRLC